MTGSQERNAPGGVGGGGVDRQTDGQGMLACVVYKKTKMNIAGALSVLDIQGLYKKLGTALLLCINFLFFFFFLYNFHVFFIVEVCVKCFIVEVFCVFVILLLCFVDGHLMDGYSKVFLLQEADSSYFHSELLIRATNVHGSNVHDGQTGRLLGLVLKDGLAPLACMFLAAVLQDAVGEAAVALGADADVVGALQQQGLLQVARAVLHVGHAVLTVVREVLGRLRGQQPQEGQLHAGGGGRRALLGVAEVEPSVHGLAEPDVFALLALACPPVLAWHRADAGVDAGLACLHVAEGLDGVGCAADVGIDPVVAALPRGVAQLEVSAGACGVLL